MPFDDSETGILGGYYDELKAKRDRAQKEYDLLSTQANEKGSLSTEQLFAGALAAALPTLLGAAFSGRRGAAVGGALGARGSADLFTKAEADQKLERDKAKLKAEQSFKRVGDLEDDMTRTKLDMGKAEIQDKRYQSELEYKQGRDAKTDERDARDFGYKQKRDNVGDAKDASKTDYEHGRDAKSDERDLRDFNHKVEQDSFNNLNAQADNIRQDESQAETKKQNAINNTQKQLENEVKMLEMEVKKTSDAETKRIANEKLDIAKQQLEISKGNAARLTGAEVRRGDKLEVDFNARGQNEVMERRIPGLGWIQGTRPSEQSAEAARKESARYGFIDQVYSKLIDAYQQGENTAEFRRLYKEAEIAFKEYKNMGANWTAPEQKIGQVVLGAGFKGDYDWTEFNEVMKAAANDGDMLEQLMGGHDMRTAETKRKLAPLGFYIQGKSYKDMPEVMGKMPVDEDGRALADDDYIYQVLTGNQFKINPDVASQMLGRPVPVQAMPQMRDPKSFSPEQRAKIDAIKAQRRKELGIQ